MMTLGSGLCSVSQSMSGDPAQYGDHTRYPELAHADLASLDTDSDTVFTKQFSMTSEYVLQKSDILFVKCNVAVALNSHEQFYRISVVSWCRHEELRLGLGDGVGSY